MDLIIYKVLCRRKMKEAKPANGNNFSRVEDSCVVGQKDV